MTASRKRRARTILLLRPHEGLVSQVDARITAPPSAKAVAGDVIIGNRNSRVYHLPQGCPSYVKVAPKNQENFSNQSAAIAAGYRKAGNCS